MGKNIYMHKNRGGVQLQVVRGKDMPPYRTGMGDCITLLSKKI